VEICRGIAPRRCVDGANRGWRRAQLSRCRNRPGPTATTITVTGLCVTTGQPRTMDFFLVNRVFVGEEPASASDEDPQRRFRADNGASSAVALGHSNAPPSYAWPAG
jgi:hypothetical protein